MLTVYKWNSKVAEHYFCSLCFVYTHHLRKRNPEKIGINVARIEDFHFDIINEVNTIWSIIKRSGE